MENQPRNIRQRINAVMHDVESARKDRYNPHHRYAYSGHEDVTAALRQALVRHGIDTEVTVTRCRRFKSGVVQVELEVKWVNVDSPEDFKGVSVVGESQPGGKGGPQPQQIGVAISYALKFAELKNFKLLGDDTPDVEQQDGPQNERQMSRQPEVLTPQDAAEPSKVDAYFTMLDGCSTRAALDKVMTAIASERGGFSKDQIRILETKALETIKRVNGKEDRT